MSVLQSKKFKRQRFTYDSFNEVKESSVKNEEYKSIVESLGMMLYTNGLISVIAVIKSKRYKNKKETPYFYLYKHLSKWLISPKILGFEYNGGTDDLFEKILELDNARTQLAITKELILLSDAFKEIVKAEIK